MNDTVADLMTPDPCCVVATASISDAARRMRDLDVGAVLVTDDDRLVGIVTDRDITIRAVANLLDVDTATVAEICTEDALTVGPDEPVDAVIEQMRSAAVRRIPVVEQDRPVGILSLGDLAVARDPGSAPGQISDSPPDR